jgi:hypothetical protein
LLVFVRFKKSIGYTFFMKNRTFRQFLTLKILTIVTAVYLLLAGGIAYYFYTSSQEKQTSRFQENLNKITQLLEQDVSSSVRLVHCLKSYLESGVLGERALIKNYLLGQLKLWPEVNGLYATLIDNADGLDHQLIGNRDLADYRNGHFLPWWYRNGNGFVYDGCTEENDGYLQEDFFQLPKKQGKLVFFEATLDPESKQISTSIIEPFYINGMFKGTVGIDKSLNGYRELLQAPGAFKTGQFYLVDPKGKILASPDKKELNQTFKPFKTNEYQIGTRPISQANWRLHYAVNWSEWYQDFNHLLILLTLGLVLNLSLLVIAI